MNKKIYKAPESKVVIIRPLQVLADSIPINDKPADGSGMQSKFLDVIAFDEDIDQ